MMGGLLGLLALHSLFSTHPLVILVQAMAFVLFLWARLTFGRRSFHAAANPTEGGLVTNGPYRYIRHPIYTALCLFTSAGAAGHWHWLAGLCAVWIIALAILRIKCEEELVVALYPEYVQYAATTWRMVPYVY
jgi:protein-S-isoprenylcysteine O-methyltransferase Ste14